MAGSVAAETRRISAPLSSPNQGKSPFHSRRTNSLRRLHVEAVVRRARPRLQADHDAAATSGWPWMRLRSPFRC